MAMLIPNTLYIVDTVDELEVIKLSGKATLPTKLIGPSDGYQLYSAYNYIVPAGATVIAATDLAVSNIIKL